MTLELLIIRLFDIQNNGFENLRFEIWFRFVCYHVWVFLFYIKALAFGTELLSILYETDENGHKTF